MMASEEDTAALKAAASLLRQPSPGDADPHVSGTSTSGVSGTSSASSIMSSGATTTSVTTEASSASTLTHSTFPTLVPDPPSPLLSRLDTESVGSTGAAGGPTAASMNSQQAADTPTSNSNMSEIAALQQALQRLEVKYEYTLAAANQQWRTKFQRLESSLKEQGRKLQATQRLLQESHAPLLTQLTKLVQKQQVAIQQQHVHQHEQRYAQQQQSKQRSSAMNESNATAAAVVAPSTPKSTATTTLSLDDRSATTVTSTSSTRDPEGHVIFKRKEPHARGIKSHATMDTKTEWSSPTPPNPTLSRDDVRAEVEQCLARRDLVWTRTQQQVESHAQQLSTLDANVQTALTNHESLRYEQVQMKQSIATNAEVQLVQGHKVDADLQTVAEALKQVLRSRKQAIQEEELTKTVSATHTDTPPTTASSVPTAVAADDGAVPNSPLINLCHLTDVPLDSMTLTPAALHSTPGATSETATMRTLKTECFHLIHQENERMMQAWGTQFDDLAVYLQDNLDAQRTSITEVRTSTFEHVDAEAKARATAVQAQYHELATKVHEQTQQIQEVKDDQEKSLIIVVESLVKLKNKVEGMSDQQSTQETLQLSSDVDMQKILRIIDTKTNEWNSAFFSYETELKKVKDELKLLATETEAMSEDREAIQEILDESLALFTSKSNTSAELWNVQFQKLERQMKLLDYEKLLNELSKVMAAWKRKFADVMRLYNHQAKELGLVQSRLDNARSGDDDRDPFNDYLELRRKKVTFHDVKVDQKKYKKVLWQAKQNRCAAEATGETSPEVIRTDDIKFYDLTFALSTEQ